MFLKNFSYLHFFSIDSIYICFLSEKAQLPTSSTSSFFIFHHDPSLVYTGYLVH